MRIKEPDEETVRVLAGLVRLTWLDSVTYSNDPETAIAYVEAAKSEHWRSAPEDARKWFDALPWEAKN